MSTEARTEDQVDETARLAALHRYDLLDTPPDQSFDRLTALAARIFDVPISIVSLVDHDRIWFKSHHGLDVEEIGREPGLCASAILHGEPWVVEDARSDPRSLANPLVAGEFGLQFYAGAPLVTRDGHRLGTICVIDREPRTVTPEEEQTLADLAEIVVDEMELRLAARTENERLESIRSEFVSTASHELRTPVAAIYGSALTLAREDLDPQLKDDLLDVIAAQSARLASLVEVILTADQVVSGRMQFHLASVDGVAAARRIVAERQHRLPAGLELTLRDDGGVPPVIADAEKLLLVLENLVENAIKYSPDGGAIELGVADADGRVRFRVADEGLGIAPAEHERVFDKFYRLDPDLNRGVSGTGLGLFICREIVRGMNGTIRVESTEGRGSVFSVELPAAG